MADATVLYFFGFRSPYAYLADTRIDEAVEEAGGRLEPHPIEPPADLTPPLEGLAAQVQAFKQEHMFQDCARWAKRLGVAWQSPTLPGAGPSDTRLASLGWYFAREAGAERAYREAVFRTHWGEGRDVSDRAVLGDCAGRAGLDREAFLDAVASGRHQPDLDAELGLALQHHVFGVPLFVLGDERFWGNDRIDFLVEALQSR